MRKTIGWMAGLVILALGSGIYAMYSIANRGTWPASWPKELEPLRSHSRTLVGGAAEQPMYEIPFTDRAEFEASWPHLVAVKSKGAPIILVRGPYTFVGAHVNAGVVVHAPSVRADAPGTLGGPIPGQNNPRTTWAATTFIELVTDGSVVDLNRIPLPPDTPIIDERFGALEKAGAEKKLAAPAAPAGPDALKTEGRPATAAPHGTGHQ